ncbi:MAG: ferritin-like domain-containing protein [Candidatus Binatia bacterium]
MVFLHTLRKKWGHFVSESTVTGERHQLLAELCEQYHAKAHDAAQLAAHAARMYYPQFRERLLRMATEEQAHVSWLRQQISQLGEDVPHPVVTPHLGQNSWECLLLDLENEKRRHAQLRRLAQTAAFVDPDMAVRLRHMCVEEQRHHDELWEMWMKSDPYTPPVPKVQHPGLEERKEEWVAQQKGEWLARRRADWEAAGRPVSWAEWEGERERQWLVNELPSLTLRWERKVAEAEIAHQEQALKKPLTDSVMTTNQTEGEQL